MPHTRHSKFNDLYVLDRHNTRQRGPGVSVRECLHCRSGGDTNKVSGGDIYFLAPNDCCRLKMGQALPDLTYYEEKLKA